MKDQLYDAEKEKELGELFKKFLQDLIENPKEVGKIMGGVFPGLLETLGIDSDFLKTAVEGLSKEKKNTILEKFTSLDTVLLLSPVKETDDEFSVKIDELFKLCKEKEPTGIERIFLKPRIQIYQKMLTGFERSWRIASEKDLPKEAVIDNRFRIVKSLSEGMYKELLLVIQELMQLAFGYGPMDSFGGILKQLEGAPIDLKVLVNRTAYDIRNADSHESADFEKDHTVTIRDKKGKAIRTITEDDLSKTISWLSNFTNSVFYSLQKNYFDYREIEPTTENRIKYIEKVFTEFLSQVFSPDSE